MPSSSDAISLTEIEMPARLDHAAALALRPEIETARDQSLKLDASKVDYLGGAGVELLLAVRAEWLGKDQDFAIDDPSEGFLQGMDRLGIPLGILTEGEAP